MQQFAALPGKKATQSSLLSGLVAWWQFDYPGSLGRDSTGVFFATNHGGTAQTSGTVGPCVNFAGNQYLEIPSGAVANTFSPGTSQFTVAVMFNPSATGQYSLVSHDISGAGGSEWRFERRSTQQFFLQTFQNQSESSTPGTGTGTNTVSGIGTWYAGFGWYNGLTINVQVNNSPAVSGAQATTGTFQSNAPFRIGADILSSGAITEPTSGSIAWVGYWNRTLTSAERTALYNGGAKISYPFYGL